MHIHSLEKWEHDHHFNIDNPSAQKGTRNVIILTLVMMVVEIVAGHWYKSMALLADGWHMGTHAAALGISLFAYIYAARHKENTQFTFGTGKVGVLGGYTSAVVLGIIAVLMGYESLKRLFSPQVIQFDQALIVAIVGFLVNIVSAFLLVRNPIKGQQHHHDHNLKAAYLHVLADALTSLLAILALILAKYFGWAFLDPVMGIVGAVIIAIWAKGLLSDTSAILLDSGIDKDVIEKIRNQIESDSDNKITDLHIWHIGAHHLSAIISLVTYYPKEPDYYKDLLKDISNLSHVSVEVISCKDKPCIEPT